MKPSAAVLRPARPADLNALYAVHTAAVREGCAGHYRPEQIAAWFHGRGPEIHLPALQAGQLSVAEVQGEVAGFVGATPGELTLLFVHPRFAGQGLGHRLFEHGLRQAGAGPSGTIVVVATRNSEAFYAARGFRAVEAAGFRRGPGNGVWIEVVKMVRTGP